MQKSEKENSSVILNLTALWAFAESGLGGLLFALKIPLTGFVIGAISIIVITLIAYFSEGSFKAIARATVGVLIIKAAASPHTSPMAYIAVAFQGFLGAFLFSFIKNIRLAAPLLGAITMVESALQKLLIMLLIFGKSLWAGIENLANDISTHIELASGFNSASKLVILYAVVYALWGVTVGFWAAQMPRQIDLKREHILHQYRQITLLKSRNFLPKKRRKFPVVFLMIFLTVLALSLYYLPTDQAWKKGQHLILRTLLILALLLFVVRPLFKKVMQKWLQKVSTDEGKYFDSLMSEVSRVKMYIHPAWQMSKSLNFLKRWPRFFLTLVVLSVYGATARIFIFSRKIRTGKTTELENWLELRKNICGIVTPDFEEKRILKNISKGESRVFEVDHLYQEEKLSVGRFTFAKSGFEWGRALLIEEKNKSAEWVVLDEVGKLEIQQQQGFEPAVTQCIQSFKHAESRGKLLLVVRENLLEATIKKYGLTQALVLHDLNTLQ